MSESNNVDLEPQIETKQQAIKEDMLGALTDLKTILKQTLAVLS